MELQTTSIKGAFVVHHKIFKDNRGEFREWFKKDELIELDLDFESIQANISLSKKGTIRGIHYSLSEKKQNKFVTCLRGRIIDFMVDLRVSSPSYLEQHSVELSYDSSASVFIPHGVGHAFQSLEEDSIVIYSLSSIYNPNNEFGIHPYDKSLNIKWPIKEGILSHKDENSESLNVQKLSGKLPP